jgi:hypothetical protein
MSNVLDELFKRPVWMWVNCDECKMDSGFEFVERCTVESMSRGRCRMKCQRCGSVEVQTCMEFADIVVVVVEEKEI